MSDSDFRFDEDFLHELCWVVAEVAKRYDPDKNQRYPAGLFDRIFPSTEDK